MTTAFVLMNAIILLYLVDGVHAWKDVILVSNIVPSNLTVSEFIQL